MDRPTRSSPAISGRVTTILLGGLTMAHDYLITARCRAWATKSRRSPDNRRCSWAGSATARSNPTYFTVGNLVKHLVHAARRRRSVEQRIVDNYLFRPPAPAAPVASAPTSRSIARRCATRALMASASCCFQQQGGLKQATGETPGLDFNPKFFPSLVMAIMVGDALNAIGYRMRPYEKVPGATDRAISDCKQLFTRPSTSAQHRAGADQCRRILRAVEVDRTKIKPKVAVIGEFWAMTTEGDGNYGLQRFRARGRRGRHPDRQQLDPLQHLGAPLGHQAAHGSAWRRPGRKGPAGVNVQKKLATLWPAIKLIRVMFKTIGHVTGLHDYYMPDMDEVAEEAKNLYNNHLRGGEGHMEVGKLVMNVKHKKSTMTLSGSPSAACPAQACPTVCSPMSPRSGRARSSA